MSAPAGTGQGGDDARDRSLLRRAQRGEAAALAELMRHHLLPAWRLCLSLTLDRDDAESLLVEVTRSFWSDALARGPGLDALGAIARLARSRAALSVRRRAGEEGAPLESRRPDGRAFGEASPYDAGYERQLLAVYASWTSEDRLLFALRAFERMPQAGIARTLALPVSETAERLAALRVRIEASMRGEEPASASGEHLSPLLLSASLDGAFAGALREDGHELVTRHLAACAACRDLSARLRRHEEGLRRLLAFDPGEAYLQDLGRYLDQLIEAIAKGRHLPLRRVRAEVLEPEAPAALAAPAAAEEPAVPAAAGPTPAPEPPPAPDVHGRLDELMAELGRGFATPRAVTRAPVEPPRSAADVMRPPSREMPRPAASEPPPATPSGLPAPSPSPAPAPTPPASARPEAEPPPTAAPTAPRAVRPVPPPPAIEALPASAVEPEAASPVPMPGETPRAPAVRPDGPRPPRTLVLALSGALAVVLALYALPPVITVSVPEMPTPRLPRIEVVRAGTERTASRARTDASSTSPPAERVRPPAAEHDARPHASPARAVPAPVRPEPTAPPHAPRLPAAPHAPAVALPSRPPQHAMPPERASPAPEPAPAAERTGDTEEDWPLLCGEVLDEGGEPVAGARVLLADLDLGARTDRRGRFCIAAPAGDRTLTVSAQGFASHRRLVSLARGTAELTLRLQPSP